jgi:hypothetical protein
VISVADDNFHSEESRTKVFNYIRITVSHQTDKCGINGINTVMQEKSPDHFGINRTITIGICKKIICSTVPSPSFVKNTKIVNTVSILGILQ